jgi:hypothetical protein
VAPVINVTVFFNPLNGKDKKTYRVEPGTQIIEFLQAEFPAGFGAPVRVFSGCDEVAPDDWDSIIREDVSTIVLVLPGAITWAQVGAYLLQAAIAVAVGYVINLIFAPKSPNGLDRGDESPVYSIGPTRNQARLGSPVPAHYGTVIYPPDFASVPYVYGQQVSNDQYVDELLCLGHGKFEIHDILIGNMSIYDLAPGSVKYWVFDSSQHLQTLGTIESYINSEVAGTDDPTPFYENMYTSPEITDFTFQDGQSEAVTWQAIDGTVVAATTDADGNAIPGRIEGITRSLLEDPLDSSKLVLKAKDVLNLRNTTSNNVEFVIGSVIDDTTVTIFQKLGDPNPLVDEDPINALAEFELNTLVDNFTAGPYRAQRDGDTITEAFVDLLFPQGLYHRDRTDGTIKDKEVSFRFTFQKILSDGSADGSPTVIDRDILAKQMAPYRWSISSGALTPGMYEVTVTRTDEFTDDRSVETCQWVGLRGAIEHDTSATVYGDVTLLAIRMKATAGLGVAARERVRVKATRVFDDDTVDTSNPITVIKDIWTNTNYGLGRTMAETEEDWLEDLEFDWSGEGGPRFNGSFDSRGTGFDAMDAVAGLNGSKVVQHNGLLSVIPDQIQEVRTAVFSTANIAEGSLSILYTFNTDGEYDGMQVEYREPDNFDVAYAYYPESPTNPETYTLFGCTDAGYAEEFARYLWNVRARRRKLATFQTELEGLLPRFGNRIGISHTIPNWGQSGVFVEQIDGTSWYVDQALDWTADNVLMIRTELGTGSELYEVTEGASPNIVVFDEAPTETIATADDREPTNYIFGIADELIKDFLVTKVTPKSDTIIEIEAQTYDNLIYEGAPPHMRLLTGSYLCSSVSDWLSSAGDGFYVIFQSTLSQSINEAGAFNEFENHGNAGDDYAVNVLAHTGYSSVYYDDHPSSFQTCSPDDQWYQFTGNNDANIAHPASDGSDTVYLGVGDYCRVGLIVYPSRSFGSNRGAVFGWNTDGIGPGKQWVVGFRPDTGTIVYNQDGYVEGVFQDDRLICDFEFALNQPMVLVLEVARTSGEISIGVYANGKFLDKMIITSDIYDTPLSSSLWHAVDDSGTGERKPTWMHGVGITATSASIAVGFLQDLGRPFNHGDFYRAFLRNFTDE